jgi:oligopeptidase B
MTMDRRGMILASASLLALGGSRRSMAAVASALPPAPITAKIPVTIDQLGRVRVDDYAWLHQPNWFTSLTDPSRLNPAIRRHLEDENAYCDAVLAPTLPLQAELAREIAERSSGAGDDPPSPDGAWLYWSQVRPGANHPTFLRRPRAGGPDQVLADFDALARGRGYYRISSIRAPMHSPDHSLFAWAVDETGDEHFRLYVKDLANDVVMPAIEACFGDFAFSPDSRWIFWVYRNAQSRPTKVFRRPVRGGEDVLVYEETDPAYFLTVRRAASNGCLFVTAFNADCSETRIVSGDDPTAAPKLAEPRTPGLLYDLEHWGDRLVVRTNADGAVDFKLMTAPLDAPSRGRWRDWVPAAKGRFIAETRAFANHFARVEWIDAKPVLILAGRTGGERTVTVDEPAYALQLDLEAEYASAEVRYSIQSPRTPRRWVAYDSATGAERLLQSQQVAHFDRDRYEVLRLDAPSADGVLVPLTVLRQRGQTRPGPAILFGYGAYGDSLLDDFSPANLSLADRGFMVAKAHTRGGGERGRSWFEASLKLKKKATIADFIACADHLVAKGLAAPGKIVAHSFSAGGILIGGALNARPGIWAGAVAEVPFVDVLNTLHDETNPLVFSSFPIWGDPSSPEVFDYIASYSPYENVHTAPYPAVLATAGLLDDRLGYWEAAKWVARLREKTVSGRPILLHTDMTGGHQGADSRAIMIARTARYQAFAIRAVSGVWDGAV